MNPPALPLLADTAAVPVADRWQTQLQIGSIRAASTEPWLVSGRIFT
ncbi:flagellum-specific ATP synthase FliI [Bordetella pertussis]|nr:flagellum-specific ATP synthase FliI [Bordetella pertussis]